MRKLKWYVVNLLTIFPFKTIYLVWKLLVYSFLRVIYALPKQFLLYTVSQSHPHILNRLQLNHTSSILLQANIRQIIKACHLFGYLFFYGSNLFYCPCDIMQCTFLFQSVLLAGEWPPNGLSPVIMMCNLFWAALWMPSVIYFNRDDLIGLIDAPVRWRVIHQGSVSYWCAQCTRPLWKEI